MIQFLGVRGRPSYSEGGGREELLLTTWSVPSVLPRGVQTHPGVGKERVHSLGNKTRKGPHLPHLPLGLHHPFFQDTEALGNPKASHPTVGSKDSVLPFQKAFLLHLGTPSSALLPPPQHRPTFLHIPFLSLLIQLTRKDFCCCSFLFMDHTH